MLRNSTPYRARKEPGNSHRRIVATGAVVMGAVVLSLFLGFGLWKILGESSFFQATAINITGNQRLSVQDVESFAGIHAKTNLLTFRSITMERALSRHAWINSATVEKHWPNSLEILVRERQPVALVNVQGILHYIDNSGTVFAAVEAGDDLDFPVISGIENIEAQRTCLEEALEFIRYSAKGGVLLPKQNISEITANSDGDLVLYLTERTFPIYLGREKMGSKYYRLTKVLYWLYKKKDFQITQYIRLDYLPDKVLVGKTG